MKNFIQLIIIVGMTSSCATSFNQNRNIASSDDKYPVVELVSTQLENGSTAKEITTDLKRNAVFCMNLKTFSVEIIISPLILCTLHQVILWTSMVELNL